MRLVFLLSLMVDSFLHFPFICLWYSIRLEGVKHIRDTKVFFSSQANLQLFFLACGKYHRDISHVERENRRFLYTGEPCLPSSVPYSQACNFIEYTESCCKRCTRPLKPVYKVHHSI